ARVGRAGKPMPLAASRGIPGERPFQRSGTGESPPWRFRSSRMAANGVRSKASVQRTGERAVARRYPGGGVARASAAARSSGPSGGGEGGREGGGGRGGEIVVRPCPRPGSAA